MSTQKTKTRRLLREVKQEENSDEESADASVETRRKRQKLETKPTKPTPSNQKDDESEEEDNDEPEQPVKATKAPEKVKVTPSASSKKEIRASFVMKLFDRSVNLSKFNIDTPLYSICRDWMRNAPRAKVKKGKKNEEEEFHERRSVPEIFSMVRNGIVAEIKFLPPVNDLSISKIPELMEFQKDLDKSKINLRYKLDCPLVPKEDLMRRHMVRWKLIRENWHAHAKDYGTQYAESFELIDGIYRKTF